MAAALTAAPTSDAVSPQEWLAQQGLQAAQQHARAEAAAGAARAAAASEARDLSERLRQAEECARHNAARAAQAEQAAATEASLRQAAVEQARQADERHQRERAVHAAQAAEVQLRMEQRVAAERTSAESGLAVAARQAQQEVARQQQLLEQQRLAHEEQQERIATQGQALQRAQDAQLQAQQHAQLQAAQAQIAQQQLAALQSGQPQAPPLTAQQTDRQPPPATCAIPQPLPQQPQRPPSVASLPTLPPAQEAAPHGPSRAASIPRPTPYAERRPSSRPRAPAPRAPSPCPLAQTTVAPSPPACATDDLDVELPPITDEEYDQAMEQVFGQLCEERAFQDRIKQHECDAAANQAELQASRQEAEHINEDARPPSGVWKAEQGDFYERWYDHHQHPASGDARTPDGDPQCWERSQLWPPVQEWTAEEWAAWEAQEPPPSGTPPPFEYPTPTSNPRTPDPATSFRPAHRQPPASAGVDTPPAAAPLAAASTGPCTRAAAAVSEETPDTALAAQRGPGLSPLCPRDLGPQLQEAASSQATTTPVASSTTQVPSSQRSAVRFELSPAREQPEEEDYEQAFFPDLSGSAVAAARRQLSDACTARSEVAHQAMTEALSEPSQLVPLFSPEEEPALTPTIQYSPQPIHPHEAAAPPVPSSQGPTSAAAASTDTAPQPLDAVSQQLAGLAASKLPELPDSSDGSVRTSASVASCLLVPPPLKCAVPAGGPTAPSARASILGTGPALAAFRTRVGAEGEAGGPDSYAA